MKRYADTEHKKQTNGEDTFKVKQQTQIEDQLSEKILEGTIRKKTEVRIEKDGDQLKFETV